MVILGLDVCFSLKSHRLKRDRPKQIVKTAMMMGGVGCSANASHCLGDVPL
jgi:hypothetical protein